MMNKVVLYIYKYSYQGEIFVRWNVLHLHRETTVQWDCGVERYASWRYHKDVIAKTSWKAFDSDNDDEWWVAAAAVNQYKWSIADSDDI